MPIKPPSYSHNDYKVILKESLHKGFFDVTRYTFKHRLYEGGWSNEFTRELLERNPGVGVLLYDPNLDKIVLIEQFRAGCQSNAESPWVIELVAGIIDTKESPMEVAEREAIEEAGLSVSHLMPVCEYYNSPGGSNEKLYIYCAKVDASNVTGIHGLDKENEDIKPIVLTRQEALAAIESGRINTAISIIALQWLALNIEKVHDHMQAPP